LYEGAGGWFCPINATETMADVVVACGWPVILVVEMRLGCLNFTRLTVEAIHAAGVPLLGWVANSRSELMPHYRENMAMLKATINAPLFAEVQQGPVCPNVDVATLL
jgi:dethiobiotin synthetase